MAVFKGHKISAAQLLNFIPEALLTHLSSTTKVDYYSKVLHGRKVFYLLLYALLENDKLSQRSLEDTFNSPAFKALFNLEESASVRRSSISERLSIIDANYFKEIFQCIYDRFSAHYNRQECTKYNLIRVDSTLVAEAAGKLKAGIDQKNGKKFIKYSVCFDGILPSAVEVFNLQTQGSEDMALPKAILSHVKREASHANIYIVDRGIQSGRTMQSFSQQTVPFIIRAKENRKYEEIASLIKEDQDLAISQELTLVKDSKVKLFTGMPIHNKKGNIHYKEQMLEAPSRLIVAKSNKEGKQFWWLTNDFELTAQEVAEYYRKRWDIEVFFRFLKQELNLKHLVSLNKNGIQVIIYMTMIVAMLLLLYKKMNEIGYTTAKRRFAMEIRELAIAMMITFSGGNPNKVFKT